MIYPFKMIAPQYDENATFIAPSADVIGKVVLAENVSVWFQAVIRADTDSITIGPDSNIQDASVLHVDAGFPLTIGKGVTVGHKAMLHGCKIDDFSLIGINAVVLNGATIGKYCIIGAGALVTEGMDIPDYSLVVGSPAKIIKTVTEQQAQMLEASAQHYVDAGIQYRKSIKQTP